MKTRTRFLALAMVATFAIAGCGEDNNNNGNDNNDNVAPTTVRYSGSDGRPHNRPDGCPDCGADDRGNSGRDRRNSSPRPRGTPMPTATAGTGVAATAKAHALNVTITSLAGSDLDTGWTGIAHNSVATHDNTVTTQLNCVGRRLHRRRLEPRGHGVRLAVAALGRRRLDLRPQHLPRGRDRHVQLRQRLLEGSAKLLSKVFLVQDAGSPVSALRRRPDPERRRQGRDVRWAAKPRTRPATSAASAISSTPPVRTSGTRRTIVSPTGSSVGELNIDLNPLSTGTVSIDANVNCLSGAFLPGSCYCPGQVQPNAC